MDLSIMRVGSPTNDAAERLLDELEVPILKALAAERRAGVLEERERIRAALYLDQVTHGLTTGKVIPDAEAGVPKRDERHQILDDLFPVDR